MKLMVTLTHTRILRNRTCMSLARLGLYTPVTSCEVIGTIQVHLYEVVIMSKINLIVRRDMEADDTLRVDVYAMLDTGLESIGYAYMRNHSCRVNNLAIDMYLSAYGGTLTADDFIVSSV